jgi:hypothetical protein
MAQAPPVLTILLHSARLLWAPPRRPTHLARRNLPAPPARLELEQYVAARVAVEPAGSSAVPLRCFDLAK